jgi:hypothetical protein
MTRFRGRWLDGDDGDEDAAASVEAVFPLMPPPAVVPPEGKLRGKWLDAGEPGPSKGVDAAPGATRSRAKVMANPKWPAPAIGAASLGLLVLGFIAILGDVNVAKALVILPILGWIAYTVAQRFALVDGQPAIVPIMMGGLAIKCVGVQARYWIDLKYYGTSDAKAYAQYGRIIAPGLRHFHLINTGRLEGTNFIRLVTGVVFAITPASFMSGYFVFGFMAYIGSIFFWRAFKKAFPRADDLRYLQVLMFLPSLAFWPSAIGKDAWMMLGVAIASYGVACILTNATFAGWVSFLVGIYMVLAVRPQVGLALFVGLFLAELLRARGSQGAARAGASAILMIVFGGIILSTTAAFLGISSFNKATVSQELNSVGNQTSQGGSQFSPTPVNNPLEFPQGAFTVLFRPMPYEVRSPQELLSAFENVALLGVIVFSLPSVWAVLRRARKQPYILYCLGTLIGFVVEYSTFSNFAIIARERTQITALMLVFICLPRQELVEVVKTHVRAGDPRPKPPTR